MSDGCYQTLPRIHHIQNCTSTDARSNSNPHSTWFLTKELVARESKDLETLAVQPVVHGHHSLVRRIG